MKISTAIEKLNKILEQHGDLEVLNNDSDGGDCPFDDYEVISGPTANYFENNKIIKSELLYGEYVTIPVFSRIIV